MIQSEQTHLHSQAASHEGMRGKQNEDRYAVTPFLAGGPEQTPSVLAIVCDGIGGHRAGEVAAEMGVSIITKDITTGSVDQPIKTMEKAIIHASDAIYKASQADLGRSGMGATCACAWVIGDRLYTANLGDSRIYLLRKDYTANLGDSRIYLLRKDHLIQLSTDHTWIQEALDAGLITDKNLMDHPNAHVIRRYLGSCEAPEPDFRMWVFEEERKEEALANQGLTLNPGDYLLLCSDGLTDLVADAEIQKVLQKSPLAQVPKTLIDIANQRGGHDNITVVVMQVPTKRKKSQRKIRKRRVLMGCLVFLAIISLVITGLFLRMRWRSERLDKQITPSPTQALTLPEETLSPTIFPTFTLSATPEQTTESISPKASHTPWPTNTVEQ